MRQTDGLARGPVEDRRPQGTRLRHEGDRAACGHRRRERRVQVGSGGDEPEAVRSEETDAVALGGGDDLALECGAGGPGLLEPRRDDDDRANPALATLIDDVRDRRSWYDDDRKIDWSGNVANRRIAVVPVDLGGFRVHWIDITGEPCGKKVVENVVADSALFTGHADHCDRVRREELLEHAWLTLPCNGEQRSEERRFTSRSLRFPCRRSIRSRGTRGAEAWADGTAGTRNAKAPRSCATNGASA